MNESAFSEKLYTSTEVAQILGVSLRSIYRYLDENKIQAAVKTATGRHRFTKENINDFLHPNNNTKPSNSFNENNTVSNEPTKYDSMSSKSAFVETRDSTVLSKEPERIVENKEPEKEAIKDEPVDWLARFRQAAEKYKSQDISIDRSRDTEDVYVPASKVAEPEKNEPEYLYYRSGVGGLKEIAQSLDKSAKNASLDYAFTMQAGLSLHKPIKPFSLIHSYIRPSDRAYFEKVLQLAPCARDTAQLCLIVSNDGKIYSDRSELHGLYVVSDQQIKLDLLSDGETDLANEIE
jgi:excisionase family DNA binding protein